MATSHFARTVYKGTSDAGSAGKRVRYITRTVTRGNAEARVRYQGYARKTDKTREDLVYWRADNLPQWAGKDPVRFFSAAERYTSSAWIAYEEWKFSLPRELSHRQQMDAARDLLQSTFGTTHPYIWALHDPLAADGGRQPHIHILWSARQVDAVARSPQQFFRRYNAAHPERGGAAVDRTLTYFGAIKAARVLYTDVMNLHLARAGMESRLHPDRLEARGILRKPEPRLTPEDSRILKARGEVTEAMQEVLDHRKRHALAKRREQRLAAVYWEGRKRELGLAREVDDARGLVQIAEARMQLVREVPTYEDREELDHPRRSRTREVEEWQRLQRLTIPLVGNRESKIFHTPGDPNYGDVTPRKQVLFWTVAEAEEAGFRAAANQHYGRGAEQRREESGERVRTPEGRSRTREAPSRHEASALERFELFSAYVQEPDAPRGRAARVRIFDEDHDERRR